MPSLIEAKPLDHFNLRVKYSDGVEGVVDLSHLAGKGVFEIWNDYREFQKVHIGAGGAIAWTEDVEICPDSIYLRVTGKKPEDLFPKLRELTPHAGD
jgi:hypothetical protein